VRIQVRIWVVGALLAALLAVGCGDNSSGSDGDEVVTKKSFLKEADAVCARQKQKLRASVGSRDPVKASAEALVVEVREIEALGSPSGDKGEIEAMMKNLRKTVDLAESGSEADLIEANEYFLRAEKQADNYGFKACFLE
jgi:hypothetical protein